MFNFAEPRQVLKAIDIYCCDNYGTMIWDLHGNSAGKFFRCWNRCVKLCWKVPDSMHTLFVEHLLGAGFNTLRVNVKSQYVKFFQSLLQHKSKEVALLSNIVGRDLQSTTGKNLRCIMDQTGLNPWIASSSKVKEIYNSQITLDILYFNSVSL